ncbi:MAG: RNA polymerase sigma factor RpoD/SigA [Spirochaetaceae bacterium]|jgi:RNA polymerase primary sigma factor|nr:RNA polymerase sigma factor RpoD/SigA [Spirochaetaceae bacterium]
MTAMKMKRTKAKQENFNASENILSTYLREINRIPLLSREEEDEAAREAAKGNKAARNKLVNGNLRFVVNVAKRYQGQGLAIMDLISEGNIGLMNAVDRYDVDKGYHFISYAVWWIRQAILKAICEKSRMIRLPLNRANELVQIQKARKIAQESQSTETEIREVAQLLSMDEDHVAELLNISREHISLDNPVHTGNRDSTALEDFIEDEQHEAPEDYAMNRALKEDIQNVLDTLDRKEADIIRFRYGLGDCRPLSLKELGSRFNLTKERIRQIEKKAIKRLQHPTRQRVLYSYIA